MSDETLHPTVYKIPERNYLTLQSKIARLQRRAKKLGTDEITISEVGFEDFKGYTLANRDDDRVLYTSMDTDLDARYGAGRWTPSPLVLRYIHVTVTGPSPVLNGWTMMGALDIVRDDTHRVIGNMVRSLPGMEMPEEYRTSEPHCDHCGIQRNWKSTYVVMNEAGEHKQVGRQCLKDFTGHKSPEAIAAYSELLMEVNSLLDQDWDDEDGFTGDRTRQRYSVSILLKHAAAIILKDGWVSRKKADETGGNSTAQDLRTWLYARNNEAEKLDEYYGMGEAAIKLAEDTREYMHSLTEKEGTLSDYEHNLMLFSLAGSVEDKAFGYVASAISAYMRTQEKALMGKTEKLVSNYVGEEKQRLVMDVTLVYLHYMESDFGVRTLCKYLDVAGNVIIWMASKSIDTPLDTKMKVKATVKGHSEYNGVKQTKVSRLEVLETL